MSGAGAGRYSGYNFSPSIAPDRTRVAFSTFSHGQKNIFDDGRNLEIATASIDGTGYQRLTDNGTTDTSPVWSPNGKHIAFVAYWKTEGQEYEQMGTSVTRGHPNIYVMAPDGSHPKIVTPGVGTNFQRPAWSPDSLTLAFLAQERIPGKEHAFKKVLYTVGADGAGLRRLSESTVRPAWSPDGARLAFGVEEDQGARIYTASPEGADIREVSQPGRYRHVSDLSWSPNGSEIRFVAARVGPPGEGGKEPVNGVHAIRVDGSGDRIVVQLPELYPVAWSLDDTRIAVYVQPKRLHHPDGPGSNVLLYSMAPDGSDVRSLVRRGLGGLVADHSGWRDIDDGLLSCSAGYVVPKPEKNPGLVQDCKALIRGRNALAGHDVPLLWNADTPISDWVGVEVGGDPPRVRGLAFYRSSDELNPLSGTIPPQLGDLEELEYLELVDMQLGGTIPPELGNLSKLGSLSLNRSGLSGSIPPELGNLSSLERLDLHWNGLSGSIPPELGSLTNLESLYLGTNQLTGSIPPELGQLPRLASLDLKRNEITGCIPRELTLSPTLRGISHEGLEPC